MRRTPSMLAALALVLALVTSCGGDDSAASGDGDADTTTTSTAGSSGGAALDGALVELTGQEVCDTVTAEVVAGALGLEVDDPTVISETTPQCSYAYATEAGGGMPSNVTVAAMSAGDVGGRDLADAFDFVVQINEQVAGGTDVDKAEVDAGDAAVRLSGEALHLGIVAAGGHLFTVIVPPDDATADQVEALLVAIGDAAA